MGDQIGAADSVGESAGAAGQRSGPCAVCGEETVVDGHHASIDQDGRVLCRECSFADVELEIFCVDCGWSERQTGREIHRKQLRALADLAGHEHEQSQQMFQHEHHETAWREVDST